MLTFSSPLTQSIFICADSKLWDFHRLVTTNLLQSRNGTDHSVGSMWSSESMEIWNFSW